MSIRTVLMVLVTLIPAPGLLPEASLGLSRAEAATVEWAEALYSEAGLELPPDISFHFSDHPEPCGGVNGLYNYFEDALLVCVPADQPERRRRVVVHELAHVWDDLNLSADDRHRFQRATGSTTWFSHEVQWSLRGAEYLAETITWGLLDPRPSPGVTHGTCTELAAQFEGVTGRPPLESSDTCRPATGQRAKLAGPGAL